MKDSRENFYSLLKYAPSGLQQRLKDLLDSVLFEESLLNEETGQTVDLTALQKAIDEVRTVAKGGTGRTNLPFGAVLVGNDTSPVETPISLMWDFVSSRLGIGTRNPQTKLHVFGSGTQVRLSDADTTYVDIYSSSGDAVIAPSSDKVTVGSGAAGVDYILEFNGETNDGSLTWMEDESYFDVEGGLATEERYLAKRTETDTYNVGPEDEVIVCNKGTAMSVNLPAATGSGRVLEIKSVGAGLVTIDANASEEIDDVTVQYLNQYECMTLVDRAAGEWVIV